MSSHHDVLATQGEGCARCGTVTQHLTTRADDDHAPPGPRAEGRPYLYGCREYSQAQVRFFAEHRINRHAPPLVRAPVNFFLSFSLAAVLPGGMR